MTAILQGNCPLPDTAIWGHGGEIVHVEDNRFWYLSDGGPRDILLTVGTGRQYPDGFVQVGTWITESPVWRVSHLLSAEHSLELEAEVAAWQKSLKK